MSAEAERHMSWCAGRHDEHGQCWLDGNFDDVGLEFSGVPCDSASIWVSGVLATVEDVERVIHMLRAWQPLVKASDVDTDCDHPDHPPHPDEDEDEEDDDVVCTGCGAAATNLLKASTDPEPERWLCEQCCDAEGIPWFHR